MPLYLVRWPGLRASVVSARDEDHLLDTLDQVADSEGVTWSLYRGPLWIDLDLPVRYRVAAKGHGAPFGPGEIVVEDVTAMRKHQFNYSAPECDHVAEMEESVARKAFPFVHEAFWQHAEEPSDGEIRTAVAQDLARLGKAAWARASRARRSDEIAKLAEKAGAPVRQIENVLRATGVLPSSKPPKKREPVRRLKRRK